MSEEVPEEVIKSIRPVRLNEFPYNDWKIRTSKSSIMTKEQENMYVFDILWFSMCNCRSDFNRDFGIRNRCPFQKTFILE